ncbi:hypothetical protein CO058_02955 [candidate division WWE3 bacterium CG_4_9_14_0_2_um_filter_35_11]|uniref:DNA polymerase III delta N-terminal domain-containing protein n=1 Tax=candidate division WWE3 bacterium CG_4_9_14_0_2_um_filter_35_11 TaxID=1975077 RepID=A0A2M8ELD5_UNCKA|nr:MAG: hypothetical protein COV25_01885 [candidate division WWE3 bacterium CG10_big_fil_rev_8_21_14_0_10_35_32]PJC23541.1 MAG: hypothetical protein CO058_02955 [candidate division WWE3 bacterium CG_4_9_14_0_2_um_filter_35_11]
MLSVISGNDSVGILNFLKSKKKSYEGQEIIEANSKNYSSLEIEDLSKSVGMFSTKKLIVMKPESVSDVDFNEEFLSFISENPDVEILVDVSKIIKTTKIYKLLVKFGKKFFFDKKRDYDVYNISDALLLQNNKNYAIDLLLNFCKTDDDFYNVLSNIHFGLRNLVASVEKNAAWNSMHPFVRKKFTNIKVDISKVKITYKKIFDLDAKSKSSSEKRLSLLVDFMLESNL